jgi:hypothetical protein
MIAFHIVAGLKAKIRSQYVFKHYIKYVLKCIRSKNEYLGNANGTEMHHIIPRSWRKDLVDDDHNIVIVTIEQHVRLHQLLAMTNDSSMVFAFWHTYATRFKIFDYNQRSLLLIEARQKMKTVNGRPVVNLHTGETFHSIREAAKVAGLSPATIRNAIEGCTKSNGHYYEYLDRVDLTQIDRCLHEKVNYAARRQYEYQHNRNYDHMKKPVICLNTQQVFDCAESAAQFLGVKKASIVQAIIKHTKSRSSYWAYYDSHIDYEKLLQQYIADTHKRYEEKQKQHSAKMHANNSNAKPIINSITGEILHCARALDERLGLKKNTALRKIHSNKPIQGQMWKFVSSC